jgi:TolA-binding protein
LLALSADDYEEDRRVSLHGAPLPAPIVGPRPQPNSAIIDTAEEEKEDEGEEVIADDCLNTNGMDDLILEENSITHTVGDQSSNSGIASASSLPSASAAFQGRQRTGSSASSLPQQGLSSQFSTSGSTSSGRASPLPGSGPGFGSRIRRYNRPVDSMATPSGSSTTDAQGRRSIPVDLDDGAFFEAEHNLRAIHEMAQEHLAHGEYEEAVEVFEEILRGQKARYGQDHYRVGTALHNLGIVYLKKGEYDKAIEICSRAVQVRKESLVPNHPDVAVSLAQLGVAHLESQQYAKAINAFRDALHIRRTFLGPRHPKCSKILNNIGCALYSMEKYEDSKRAFDEALDIQRETLRNLPSAEGSESNGMQSNALLLSMASTLCNVGSIKLRWGEYDDAIVALEEALLVSLGRDARAC